ncbi:MAG TPA: nucleotide exchange factor GrpE [Azospirillaceae bacterium]|nr:nucleotide exchange factor GrpE [Azospirillaceae bacterium]
MNQETKNSAEAPKEAATESNVEKNGGQPQQPAAASEAAQAVAPPEERIAQLEAEVAGLKDQLLRATAEVENVRRRAQREREDTAKFAVSNFAKELLPVQDNLQRALEAVPADARETDELLRNLFVGVEATARQLGSAFEKAGIQKLEPVGEPFDPNFHQVMFEVENTGKPAGSVVQVLQAGYTIHGRLLREAIVGVAKRGAEEPGNGHIDTKA